MSDKMPFRLSGPPEHEDVGQRIENVLIQAAPQGSDQWHEAHSGKITASYMGLLFKKSQSASFAANHEGFGKTAASYLQLLAMEIVTKRNDLRPELEQLPQIEWGKVFEPCAIQFYEQRYDDKVEPVNFIPFGADAGGSPDGISAQKGVLEVKCPKSGGVHAGRLFDISDNKTLLQHEPDIYWQLKSNMRFCDCQYGFFISFDPRMTPNEFRDIDKYEYNAYRAFESASELEKQMALLCVEVELSQQDIDMIEGALERAIRLRNRFVEEIKNKLK